MVEFRKPGRRPEKGNTEWPCISLSPSLSPSLALSWPTHLQLTISNIHLINYFSNRLFFKATPYTEGSTLCGIVHVCR